ncbi:MAG: hypothetical protein GY848_00420 [Methyloversatilis sp.]|nr:hypothetical protein [Methyloversatilis sp.]
MRAFIVARGREPLRVTVPQLIDDALAFYRSVPASGLASGPDTDMLLFQWAVFDWGQGERFEIDLTRQFISSSLMGDSAISQLRYTALFIPTAGLRAIPPANRWCRGIADPSSFDDFIRQSTAYRAVADTLPQAVQLNWDKV